MSTYKHCSSHALQEITCRRRVIHEGFHRACLLPQSMPCHLTACKLARLLPESNAHAMQAVCSVLLPLSCLGAMLTGISTRAGCARRPATQRETAFLYTSCAIKSRAAKVILCLQSGVLETLTLCKDAQQLTKPLQLFDSLPPYEQALLPSSPPSSSSAGTDLPQGTAIS